MSQTMDSMTEREVEGEDRPFGPVAAAFLSAGIGALVLGILTTINEASTAVSEVPIFFEAFAAE